MRNTCPFNLSEKIIMDGDKSIIAVVVAVMFETTGCSVKISWISGGQIRREWIEDWRLSKWEE